MTRSLISTCVLLIALLSVASSQEPTTGSASGWRLELEIGRHAFPGSFNDSFGLAKWDENFTIRAGIGRNIQRHIAATAFAEYRKYSSEARLGDMFPWMFLESYDRSEIACYASLTALGFVEGGVGGIWQSHEELLYRYSSFEDPTQRVRRQPAEEKIRLFYIVAMKYEIPFGAGFYVPVSLAIDTFLGHYGITVPTFRIGLAKEFK